MFTFEWSKYNGGIKVLCSIYHVTLAERACSVCSEGRKIEKEKNVYNNCQFNQTFLVKHMLYRESHLRPYFRGIFQPETLTLMP